VSGNEDKWRDFMRLDNGNSRDLFAFEDDESSEGKAKFWVDLYEDWQKRGVSVPDK
jgi:hypothetical protein